MGDGRPTTDEEANHTLINGGCVHAAERVVRQEETEAEPVSTTTAAKMTPPHAATMEKGEDRDRRGWKVGSEATSVETHLSSGPTGVTWLEPCALISATTGGGRNHQVRSSQTSKYIEGRAEASGRTEGSEGGWEREEELDWATARAGLAEVGGRRDWSTKGRNVRRRRDVGRGDGGRVGRENKRVRPSNSSSQGGRGREKGEEGRSETGMLLERGRRAPLEPQRRRNCSGIEE